MNLQRCRAVVNRFFSFLSLISPVFCLGSQRSTDFYSLSFMHIKERSRKEREIEREIRFLRQRLRLGDVKGKRKRGRERGSQACRSSVGVGVVGIWTIKPSRLRPQQFYYSYSVCMQGRDAICAVLNQNYFQSLASGLYLK